MILVTGATGNVGSALLRQLVASGTRVRCLVRDPRRLGPERVRVQIALGDLAEPFSFRNALRGVDTVVHLAAAIRDQPRASLEELNAVATLRLLRAAERAGVERFLFFSALGASLTSRAPFFRAKALAERSVESSPLQTVVFAPSIVYSPSDPFLTLLERMSLLPVMPISGSGQAAFQPIWAEDVMIALVTITVDSRGSRVAFIHYVPIWVRHPDYVVLPAGIAWRTDPADAAELRASYRRTVATVGRGPRVQPIPASLG